MPKKHKYKEGDLIKVIGCLPGLGNYVDKIGKITRVFISPLEVGEHKLHYRVSFSYDETNFAEQELRIATQDEHDRYYLMRFANA